MLNKIFLISLFFVLSANTKIYAGLYEDLNKIKQSRFKDFTFPEIKYLRTDVKQKIFFLIKIS
ncbi:hypothetical protein HE1_00101 [Holospora elegans E1]|uniref:Uncharacterized protein n=1 Tax=Holospora elegans E1 TaxID=1427503 RepID=A0A023DX32_9PROT|nr:hypothetical protein HE1_00101 [Holospora elegans E1]